MKKIPVIALILIVAFTSCKKDTVNMNPASTGAIILHFDNIAGNADLALNTATYTNAAGENYTISKFDYYVSNIKFTKTDGSVYTVSQDSSYFLIKESDPHTQEPMINNIPVGDYDKVSFMIGIDSARSAANIDRRTGVLDPGAGGLGMYWAWNSGYIFLKMEGTSAASAMPANAIQYHIGGFGGYSSSTINNIKTVTLPFPTGVTATIRADKTPEVHLLADAKKVLNGTVNISIAAHPMVMFDPISIDIANNYSSMFIVDHVHND